MHLMNKWLEHFPVHFAMHWNMKPSLHVCRLFLCNTVKKILQLNYKVHWNYSLVVQSSISNYQHGWQCMTAVAAGCRKATVSTEWAIFLLSSVENTPFALQRLQFWYFRQLSVWRAFFGWRTLTIKHLLMSGCDQGHEPVQNMWGKLWLKFLGLTPS